MRYKPSLVLFPLVVAGLYLLDQYLQTHLPRPDPPRAVQAATYIVTQSLAYDWFDTNLDVCRKTLIIDSRMSVDTYQLKQDFGVNGIKQVPERWASKPLFRNQPDFVKPIPDGIANELAFPNLPFFALIAQINKNGTPFPIDKETVQVQSCGRLFMKLNTPKTGPTGTSVNGVSGLDGYVFVQVGDA